jgi:TolB-like protein
MLLLVLGLPVVITLAGYHGARASRRISGPELTIISILLVMSSLLFFMFVRPSEEVAAVSAVQQAGVVAARRAAADPHGAISVAVMPFANLSSEKEQEFFSDGITDEIGTALAKIPDLRVVARRSAYRFKDGKEDARAIGQALSATHLLEGSVRKAGNRVRISAELVKADDGLRIWAENYDRDLTDVFAIQEDIARAIAASLRMPLGIKPGEQLVNERTASAASHEDYLRAKGLLNARNPNSIARAITILEDVVSRDSNYAPAWGLLGTAYHFQLLVHPAVIIGAIEEARPLVRVNLAKGQTAAERAVMLDPKSPDGYLALAEMRNDVGDHLAGMELLRQALMFDPDHTEALQSYSTQLASLGYLKQALPVRNHLLAVEPFVPAFQTVTARLLFASGRTDEAIAILMKFGTQGTLLPQIYASQGRTREAADILAAIQVPDPAFQPSLETAIKLLRSAPTPPNSPELGILSWVYLYTGAPERFLFAYEKGVQMGYQSGINNGLQWAPAYATIRKTERFKKYVRDAGMVEYWRAKGWPDACHPVGADDFACD